MRYISLFTGIGGFDLAADELGLEFVFGSEINKFAIQTYEANFGRNVWGDINSISPAAIPDHEILLAGFPCQDLSLAGKRTGIMGEKSCLFFAIPDILKAKQPPAFLLENVKGLLYDKESLNIVMSELSNAGYKISYKILNSKNFGVPQNRERLYFIGYRKDIAPLFMNFPTGSTQIPYLKDILEPTVPSKYVISERYLTSLEARSERHRLQGSGYTYTPLNPKGIAGTLHVGGSSLEANLVRCYYASHSKTNIKNIEQDRQVAYTLDTTENNMVIGQNDCIRKLTPREYARLQGFPDSFIIPVSDTQAYKQFGNSVTVPVIKSLLSKILLYLERIHI